MPMPSDTEAVVVAAEQALDGIGQQHAAGDARRRAERAVQEAAAARLLRRLPPAHGPTLLAEAAA